METKYFRYLQCFVWCLCGIIESVWLVDAASSWEDGLSSLLGDLIISPKRERERERRGLKIKEDNEANLGF